MAKARDYKREYKLFHGTPEHKADRAARGRSRYALKKAGVNVAGKDVDHEDGNPRNTRRSNLTVMSASKNRSKK